MHRQPSAAEPPFRHLLPALRSLGTWLGTAWEPLAGFTCLHWGFAAGRDGRRDDALQTKGEPGACPRSQARAARGLSQKGRWELPVPLQVCNLPTSSREAQGG